MFIEIQLVEPSLQNGKIIGDVPILIVEVLATREALKHAIRKKNPKVIIESDSFIAIQAINGNNASSFLIENLVEDIKNLARQFENITSSSVVDLLIL